MGKESIIYGRRVVQEVLNSKIKVESIYISKNVKKDKILGILEYAKKNV
ncbi:Putative RNA methyltransferase [Candidatus Arthromitus sp. SFB-5]|nr:Putative RNA methyltransferase [Candidatus Arthromitus sp. SFB-5]